MATRLFPCSSCTRHVKVGSLSCPFCGGDVPVDIPARPGPSTYPLSRVAIVLAGAAAASACSSSTGGNPAPAYGIAVLPDAGAKDAAEDHGEFVTHYGVAVLPDGGEPGTLYGAAILPDSGSK